MPNAQERLRVNMGLQCPECSGVRVDSPQHGRFICTECGCQWGRHYYPDRAQNQED
jgi:transcription initiation factor TFIIIB Brf1 subunit/transcription initiation factor TFIIB